MNNIAALGRSSNGIIDILFLLLLLLLWLFFIIIIIIKVNNFFGFFHHFVTFSAVYNSWRPGEKMVHPEFNPVTLTFLEGMPMICGKKGSIVFLW